ncbi:MAG TPA: DUF4097 family beta strand repeat-containing protein [Bryobacteraceae bacterium]|jgi:hypothetical protein
MLSRLRVIGFTGALAGACFVLSACDEILDGAWNRAQEDFHYSYPLVAGGKIEVDNFNGSIDISGWDQNTVEIGGTKYAGDASRLKDVQIEVTHTADSVTIRTTRPPGHWGSSGVRYSIRIPRHSELARISSSNGAIHADSIDGPARLHTSNGAIRGYGITGMLDLQTSNGAIDLTDLSSPTTAHTSNGSVSLSFDQIREVHASTSNGRITLRLPGTPDASINARTSNGSIHSEFDVTTHGLISKHRLEGTVGAGGPVLDLSTSNGSIQVLRR